MIVGQLAVRSTLHRDVVEELLLLVLRHVAAEKPLSVRAALTCVLLLFQSQRPTKASSSVVKALLRLSYVVARHTMVGWLQRGIVLTKSQRQSVASTLTGRP